MQRGLDSGVNKLPVGQITRLSRSIREDAAADPHAGLPDPSELGSLSTDLRLYSDDINSIDTSYRIAQALEAEEAALSADPRITNSISGLNMAFRCDTRI